MKKLPPNASRYTSVGLVAVGLLMIYLGWNGAASAENAVDIRAQFPFLISGGIFGLGLLAAGLTLIRVFEGRKDTMELSGQLERLTLAVERLESVRTAEQLAAANMREATEAATTPQVPRRPATPFEQAT